MNLENYIKQITHLKHLYYKQFTLIMSLNFSGWLLIITFMQINYTNNSTSFKNI